MILDAVLCVKRVQRLSMVIHLVLSVLAPHVLKSACRRCSAIACPGCSKRDALSKGLWFLETLMFYMCNYVYMWVSASIQL